jgi:hypothetical protein
MGPGVRNNIEVPNSDETKLSFLLLTATMLHRTFSILSCELQTTARSISAPSTSSERRPHWRLELAEQ